MSDKGILRDVGREAFGLAVRLLGLWVAYIAGYSLVREMTSGFHSGRDVASAVLGLVIGCGLICQADKLCRLSYGARDSTGD